MIKMSKNKLSKLLSIKNIFFIFGIAVFSYIILMFFYFLAEKSNIAPVIQIVSLDPFNQGESIILFVVLQMICLFTAMFIIYSIVGSSIIKKKKKSSKTKTKKRKN